MAARHVGLSLLVLLAVAWAPPLSAQELALADRGPRFLLASVEGRTGPVEIEATSSALLRRVVSLELERPTVATLLEEITRQTGLTFFYAKDVLSPDRPVTLQADRITVATALIGILMDTGVDVMLTRGRQVALVRRPPPPQPGRILGRVTDQARNAGISGAEVLLEGTRWRALTGEDGSYLLAEVAPGAYTLTARRIGYAKQSRTVTVVDGQDVTADIALQPAPTTLQEVVVSAQKREQALYDVPMTIAALPAVELKERNLRTIQDLALAVPEVSVFSIHPGQHLVMMRGIGDGGGTLPLVGLYLDEVAVSGTVARPLDLRTPDLDRIEVLHGPQGTLYGQGSAGGTIRFITKDPTFDRASLESTVDASVTESGSSTQKLLGLANVPLVKDVFGLRVAATYENDGGWVDAPTAGRTDINGGELYNVRVKGLWNVTDFIALHPMVIVHKNDLDGQSNGENADGDVILPPFAPTAVLPAENHYDLYSLTGTIDLGPVEILNATSYYWNNGSGGFTTTFGPFFRLHAFDTRDRVFNQEIRLASRGAPRLDWTLGVFYRDADFVSHDSLNAIGADTVATILNLDFPSIDRSKSWSFFGNAGFKVTDKLEIGGGARYFLDRKSTPQTNGLQRARFHSFDPRIYASYAITGQVKAFASAAKGFRSGGFNAIDPQFPPDFEPEKVYSYELGAKFVALDSRLSGEISGYFSQFRDMQAPVIDPVLGVGYTANVGKARIRGVDWSLQYEIAGSTTLGFGGNVVSTRVTEIVDGAALIEGDRLNHIPDYNYTASIQQRFAWAAHVAGRVRVDYEQKGKAGINLRNVGLTDESDVLNVLNARLGATWKSLSVDVYAQNILDDRGRLSPNPINYARRLTPRTIGVQVGTRF